MGFVSDLLFVGSGAAAGAAWQAYRDCQIHPTIHSTRLRAVELQLDTLRSLLRIEVAEYEAQLQMTTTKEGGQP